MEWNVETGSAWDSGLYVKREQPVACLCSSPSFVTCLAGGLGD